MRIIKTPLSAFELVNAATNYLDQENYDIPPEVITAYIAEAAEEALKKFVVNLKFPQEFLLKLNRRTAKGCASRSHSIARKTMKLSCINCQYFTGEYFAQTYWEPEYYE